MSSIETIDGELVQKSNRIVLHSKLSVALAILLLSPIFGAILYASNLHRTNQSKKIFGAIATIILCNMFALLPLLGFYLGDFKIPLHGVISRTITVALVIFPLWSANFGSSNVSYKFDVKYFVILFITALVATFTGIINTILLLPGSYFEIFSPAAMIFLILIGKNIIDLIKGEPFRPKNSR